MFRVKIDPRRPNSVVHLCFVLLAGLALSEATAHAEPVLDWISPTSGPGAGRQFITIYGSGFDDSGTTRVTFGGIDATNVLVYDSYGIRYLSCTTPRAAAGGVVAVVVYNPDGSSATLPEMYTYDWTPTISASGWPRSAPLEGGTLVRLAGSNFMPTGSVQVKFGNTNATQVATNPRGEVITCAAPPRDGSGLVDVTVTNADTTTATYTNYFYYDRWPHPTSLSVGTDVETGGATVVVHGVNFSTMAAEYGVTSVMFGDSLAATATVQDANTINCIAPPHEPGVVDVKVIGPGGSVGVLSNAFEYTAEQETDAYNMAAVGHYGGVAGPVTVLGSHALVGSGPEMLVIDVSNPGSPVQVGSWVVPRAESSVLSGRSYGNIYEILSANGLAFVSAGLAGLYVVDIADPAKPVTLGSYAAPDVRGCVVKDNLAYVADWGADVTSGGASCGYGIAVLDVSSPAAITRKSFSISNLSCLSSPKFSLGDRIAADSPGISSVDVSDPAHPLIEGFLCDSSMTFRSTKVDNGSYVLMTMGGSADAVVNRAERFSSDINVFLGDAYWLGSGITDIAQVGNYLYVCTPMGISILNPYNPDNAYPEVGFFYGAPQRIFVQGNHAYVSDLVAGLVILDASNPLNPIQLGSCTREVTAFGLCLSGQYLYVANNATGLTILDVSTPAKPFVRGSLAVPTTLISNDPVLSSFLSLLGGVSISPDLPIGAWDVAVQGNYAYVADNLSGLVVVNVTAPNDPQLAGSCPLPGGYSACRVAVSGPYAYVLDTGGHVTAIDITDPMNPAALTQFGGGSAFGIPAASSIGAFDHYVYYTTILGGFAITDVQDLSAPATVASFWADPGLSILVTGAVVANGYAYVEVWNNTDDISELRILDVHTPEAATLAGSCSVGTDANNGIQVSGGYAYIGVTRLRSESSMQKGYPYSGTVLRGVAMIDVSNPADPHIVGSYDMRDPIMGLAAGKVLRLVWDFAQKRGRLRRSWAEGECSITHPGLGRDDCDEDARRFEPTL